MITLDIGMARQLLLNIETNELIGYDAFAALDVDVNTKLKYATILMNEYNNVVAVLEQDESVLAEKRKSAESKAEKLKEYISLYREIDRAESVNTDKQRLFVDMDGTLAVFSPVNKLETLYEKGYFEGLQPQEKVVKAIRYIIQHHPEIEVNVLSAYLTDSAYALDEKNAWLDKNLPEIGKENRIFLPCGSDKKEYVKGLRRSDFLLDDYTVNLNSWEPPARGIKLLTDINNTHGTWTSDRIRFDKTPEELANNIITIMQGRERIYDESPQRRDTVPKNIKSEPLVGVAFWANGDRQAFTDRDAFVSMIRKEIDYRASNGFSYNTLTKDPETRKSIDDILFNLHGENNPHGIEDYRERPLSPESEQFAKFFYDLSNTHGLEPDVIKEAFNQGIIWNGVSNNSKDFCFYGRYNASSVAIFSDPINALSHASINRLTANDFQSIDRLVAGKDVLSVLQKHLVDNPDIKNIVVCFDADEAGTKAALELKDKLYKAGYTPENGYHCERQLPTGYKDFNQFLVSCRDTLEGQPSLSRENTEEYEYES